MEEHGDFTLSTSIKFPGIYKPNVNFPPAVPHQGESSIFHRAPIETVLRIRSASDKRQQQPRT